MHVLGWQINFLAACSHPQTLPVGNEFDGAIFIRAVNIVLAQSVNQSLHDLRAGMAKGIICSDANHRYSRVNRSQELRGSGLIPAMMSYLGD